MRPIRKVAAAGVLTAATLAAPVLTGLTAQPAAAYSYPTVVCIKAPCPQLPAYIEVSPGEVHRHGGLLDQGWTCIVDKSGKGKPTWYCKPPYRHHGHH